jgi:hypothetical protein
MSDILSPEEFEHFHRDGLKNLEIDKMALAEGRQVKALAPLDVELRKTLNEIIAKISSAGETGPEQVFKEGIAALDKMDAKRYLIENLLESVKRGDKIVDAMQRYKDLGLLSPNSTINEDPQEPKDFGDQLTSKRSIWKRATTAVVQITVNALKSIPKWIEIEPHFAFLGPIPMIMFTLKGKGMSIHDLFETLRAS